MKNLAISLLVVGAVFGNLAYSADGQIEQLKIELQERLKILNRKKDLFALSIELASETKFPLLEPSLARQGILWWRSDARESVKRAQVNIESIKRKIEKLTDLKSGSRALVYSAGDQIERLIIALGKKVDDLDKFSQRIDKFNEEFEIVLDRLARNTSKSFVLHALKRASEINNTKKRKMEVEIDSIERQIEELTNFKIVSCGSVHSPDHEIKKLERLKIALKKKENDLDRQQGVFKQMTELRCSEDYSHYARHQVLSRQSQANKNIARTEIKIESIKKQIKELTDDEITKQVSEEKAYLCMRGQALSCQSIPKIKIVKLNPLKTVSYTLVCSADGQIKRKIEKLNVLKADGYIK